MIYEDILVCAEKVEGIGKFVKNLDRGDLRHSEELFFVDAGLMLIKTAEEIKGFCNKLEQEAAKEVSS